MATDPNEALIRALTENSQAESRRNMIPINEALYYFDHTELARMTDMPNIENKNIRVELEDIEKILNKRKMKIFFHDATDKELNIPAVIVFIKGAKYNPEARYKLNLYAAMLEELIATEESDNAINYVNEFKKLDQKNQHIYEFIRGRIVLKRNSDSLKRIKFFAQLSDKVSLGKYKVWALMNAGLYYQYKHKLKEASDCYLRAINIDSGCKIEDLQSYHRIMHGGGGSSNLAKLLQQSRSLFTKLKMAREIRDWSGLSLQRVY